MRSAFVGPSPSVDARPRCRIVVAVLATSVALALLAGSARAESSIFDDDYTGTEVKLPPRKKDPELPPAPPPLEQPVAPDLTPENVQELSGKEVPKQGRWRRRLRRGGATDPTTY